MPQEDTITSAIEGALADATPPAEVTADEPIAGDETPEATPEAGEGEPEAGTEPEAKPDDKPAAEAVVEQPKKKRGPIPYDRHEAVLTKARREAEARQQELQQKLEGLSKYESQDHQAQLKFLELLTTNPKQAVAILQQVDPQRFENLTWAEKKAEAAAAVAETMTAPTEPLAKPEEDVILPDGTLGYSAKGAQALLEWRIAQERAEYQKELKALREEIGPVKSEHEARAAYNQSLQKMSVVLQDARANWPEFTAHEAEMRQALEKNPTWDLNAAYRAVVVPKLKSSRESIEKEVRKRVFDEMNAKGKATTVTPGQKPAAGAPPESNDPDERMLAAIRDSVATLK